jgi:Tfp pilus assembly protein PilX
MRTLATKSAALLRRAVLDERGYTMIFAVMVLLVSSLLVAGAFAGASGDISLTQTSLTQKKAYYAAQAGLQVYQYQLNAEPNYWTNCPKTSKATAVPGTSDETYTYETLPSTGHAKCEEKKLPTIIESADSASGTFRVRATGKSGKSERSIVATMTHPGFLNYVFMSNYEVEDPTTITPHPKNCEHYYEERVKLKVTNECPPIPFIAEDELNGPFHTNDGVAICSIGGAIPAFGRNSSDVVEMNEGHYQSSDFGCGGTLEMHGKYTTEGPTLTPPETDEELLETAGYKFKGRTVIELKSGSPNTMKITNNNVTETKNFPANGIIYVSNNGSCPYEYSPFVYDQDYEKDEKAEKEKTSSCGNVYIKGTYTESLTVASQNDVIIVGSITTTSESSGKPTGAATLGLIANDFVRVYHPVKTGTSNTRENCNASNQNASEDPRGWGSLSNPVIDAAILSTKNSFIVDNFTCGNLLGTLTIWGAIAQNWRGRVTGGPTIGGGYTKSYNYDERLATEQPPNFLSPTSTSGWRITRETAPIK